MLWWSLTLVTCLWAFSVLKYATSWIVILNLWLIWAVICIHRRDFTWTICLAVGLLYNVVKCKCLLIWACVDFGLYCIFAWGMLKLLPLSYNVMVAPRNSRWQTGFAEWVSVYPLVIASPMTIEWGIVFPVSLCWLPGIIWSMARSEHGSNYRDRYDLGNGVVWPP